VPVVRLLVRQRVRVRTRPGHGALALALLPLDQARGGATGAVAVGIRRLVDDDVSHCRGWGLGDLDAVDRRRVDGQTTAEAGGRFADDPDVVPLHIGDGAGAHIARDAGAGLRGRPAGRRRQRRRRCCHGWRKL
jgi:hypothetical protein